jgi:hypothetical protein
MLQASTQNTNTKHKTILMQRYNPFNLIHKGLRAMLYDAALTLQQTNFAEEDEAAIALEKVEDVLFLFENHAHHEDSMVLPAVEAYESKLAKEFEEEHEEDLRLTNRLKNLIIIFRNVYFTEEKMIAGSAISKSFVEFMVFNLEHMAREEMLLTQALWKYYTDEQLLAISQKIAASIAPAEAALGLKWMMRGINNDDAINWLKSVRQSAGEVVFNSLIRIAETELPAHRFSVIEEAVEADAITI